MVSESEQEEARQQPKTQPEPSGDPGQTPETRETETFTQTQREPDGKENSSSPQEAEDKSQAEKPRQFLSSSTEEQQEEEDQQEAIPGAIESEDIQADMSSEGDGEQRGTVAIVVQWKGKEYKIEVPPRIRHERLCQRIKRQLKITRMCTLKCQTRMSTATGTPGERIRVVEYVKVKIRGKGEIMETQVPEEMKEEQIHGMAHAFAGWGSERTQMGVQESHQAGKWRENEKIAIVARTPTIHLDMKHRGHKIQATMAADTTLEQLEAHARKGFGRNKKYESRAG
jgi:hypothetical protein